MTITKRLSKGSALTHLEMDANFDHVTSHISSITSSAGAASVGFIQANVGGLTSQSRTMQAKGREVITSADFSDAPIGLTGVGTSALSGITSGYANTALGHEALKVNSTGTANVAVGYQAMFANTQGGSDVSGGNTAVGTTAMRGNTTGHNNTALGVDALFTNTSGSNNVAIGSNALGFGTGGDSNTAVGWRSLFNGAGGTANTAIGLTSLNTFTTGSYNAALGTSALFSLASGSNNTGAGAFSLYGALGSGNVALGFMAGFYETGSNSFYVDNQDRTNEANGKISALLYGTFNASPSLQTLRLNGKFAIDATPDADGKLKVAVTDGAHAGIYLSNANNTANSGARLFVDVAGTSGGDPWALFLVQGVGGWSVGLDNSASDAFVISNNATLGTNNALSISTSLNATFGGSLTTSAPTGGTAAAWKLGTVASVSPTSPNRTIEVDIAGTIYYIHAKTTNN